MKLCSRCRSENNGDLKFCNFCGARMRSPLPFDAFDGPAPMGFVSQAVPISSEINDGKLAYRYFLKGKQAFNSGDLDRAKLMFQCALDAKPEDTQVKAFLARVAEAKRKTKEKKSSFSSSSLFTKPSPSAESAKPSPSAESAKPSPFVQRVNTAPKNGPAKLSIIHSMSSAAPAQAVLKESAKDSSSEPVANDGAMTPPTSPAESLDYAPESEFWQDFLATGLVIFGLAVFAWVLLA